MLVVSGRGAKVILWPLSRLTNELEQRKADAATPIGSVMMPACQMQVGVRLASFSDRHTSRLMRSITWRRRASGRPWISSRPPWREASGRVRRRGRACRGADRRRDGQDRELILQVRSCSTPTTCSTSSFPVATLGVAANLSDQCSQVSSGIRSARVSASPVRWRRPADPRFSRSGASVR